MRLDLVQPSRGFRNNHNGHKVSINMVGARNEEHPGNRNDLCCPSTSGFYNENTGYGVNGRSSNSGLEACVGDGNIMHALENREPNDGMEFESKEEAFSYYKEYAESVGFSAIIKSSRRSRMSGSFIDAKFVCTRYGSRQESAAAIAPDSVLNSDIVPRIPVKKKRGRINQSWLKTDCKACMHVKKRQDGRWIICNFTKEHSHEIFPTQAYNFRGHQNIGHDTDNVGNAARERTKTMQRRMSRQYASHKKVANRKGSNSNQATSGKHLSLEEGDIQSMLDSFVDMQDENPFFFYAIGLNEEQKLRSVFWVDAKGRLDYGSFHDVVLLDTTCVKTGYKLPLALFIGVNHHFQLLLLGCALVADETNLTYVWLMRAWLKAMGGHPPKVILTDQDRPLKESVAEVFPNTRHCFCLWHVLSKIPEKLSCVMRQHDKFMPKLNKCIFKSCTPEQFEKRWWKIVDTFNLRNDSWFKSLYEDREKWVPTFMRDIFLAGMSTTQRSENVVSFFDKHVQRRTIFKEFLEHYRSLLQDKHEEEARADFESRHNQLAVKSPSPFEKQMAVEYTKAIFKKFQVEVVGVVACHPKKERENWAIKTYMVQDFDKKQDFLVTWDETTSDISCLCRSFEYNGFLCRHVMIVLQMSGAHIIPSQYILKRWTKDARSRQMMGEASNWITLRIQRYKDICQRAFKLVDEGSSSQENYNVALNALEEALKKCESAINPCQSIGEPTTRFNDGLLACQEVIQDKGTFRKNGEDGVSKKMKVNYDPDIVTTGMHDSWQQMGQLNLRAPSCGGCFVTQQLVEEMGQLNSRTPNDDDYYGTQDNMQGLGHLNSIAPVQDNQYITQERVHGMAQLHLRTQDISSCYELRDGSQDMEQPGGGVGSSQLHAMTSKLCQAKHIP